VKITDNVYVVPEVRANAYLLFDSDGVTLIDAGLPLSQKKILAYLATLGKAPTDLRRIILTHGDLDHVGSLAALHRATSARTYASKIEAEAIAAGKSPRPINIRRPLWQRLVRLLIKQKPFQVHEILTDGQLLPILGGLQVVDTAGHTPGHISLFAPAAGILFCGDSMVTDENGIHGSRPQLTWDQGKAAEAVRRQAALGARILCSGHGPVIMDAVGKYPV
jgi:glyoxylase-like metal-dependent hydrolase (beta-lactamase superfamily II)